MEVERFGNSVTNRSYGITHNLLYLHESYFILYLFNALVINTKSATAGN